MTAGQLAEAPAAPRASRPVCWGLALGLLILSPLCAEYVVGYDTSTGNPRALVGGLLLLAPLYGAPALLIRELARRHDVRWPGVLALAGACGIVQAGVVDQSLFSTSYRDIPDWAETRGATLLPALGLSAAHAVNFLGGHVVWSFGIPIALTEGLHPASARRPWLRRSGLVATVLLYLAAAALVLRDHLRTQTDHASAPQLAGSLLAAGLLVLGAFTLGRRRAPALDRRVTSPALVAAGGLVAALVVNLVPATWAGVAGAVLTFTAAMLVVCRQSRSPRWSARHVVALATGALVARALVGFLTVPLGDVDPIAKYLHNTGFLLGALGLGAWAYRRSARTPRKISSPPAEA